MGTTKAEEFSVKDNRVAMYAKALSHPARIAILKFLINQNACFCRDIVDELPLSQSTISQHLKELKEVGLIKGEIDGASVCYCINQQVWDKVRETMNELFVGCNLKDECC